MKIRKPSLVFATATTLMFVGIVGALWLTEGQDFLKQRHFFLGAFCISIVFIINYMGVEYLIRYYIRTEIQKITGPLHLDFFDKNPNNISFKELSERLNKNASEIDMIKEMEAYRKEYIGNVSHELKTPLFAIQGYVDILQDGGSENPIIVQKYLQRIGKSVERLKNIVTDLDTINRFEAGEIELSFEKFDINHQIKEIFELLDLEAQKTGACLTLETSSTNIWVFADKNKIAQVLTNLISNAIYYSNRQYAQIKVSTKILNCHVQISVADNGMGIKAESLSRIFERFYRVESSRSRRAGGSGLGLSIVKHILEAHGESITVASRYLEGTQFSFTLRKAP